MGNILQSAVSLVLLFPFSPVFSAPQVDISTTRTTIQSIEIIGSTHFKQETLLEHLQWTRVDGEYHRERMAMDIDLNLKGFLKEYGFVDCKTRWSAGIVSSGKVDVRIVISEGPQYRMEMFDFEGCKIFSKDSVKSLFDLQRGDLVNSTKIKNGLDRLIYLYANEGYLGCKYIVREDKDPKMKVIDYLFTIDEGKQFRTGIIGIVGCGDQEEEDQLRVLIKLKAGDVFRQSDLEGSVFAINNSSMFQVEEENGSMVFPDMNEGIVNIIFYVKPQN